MNDNKLFIPVEINYYHGKSTTIGNISFKTIKDCKKHFNETHRQHPEEQKYMCDYCNAKWSNKSGRWMKGVDHDGAYVEYIVHEIKQANIVKPNS